MALPPQCLYSLNLKFYNNQPEDYEIIDFLNSLGRANGGKTGFIKKAILAQVKKNNRGTVSPSEKRPSVPTKNQPKQAKKPYAVPPPTKKTVTEKEKTDQLKTLKGNLLKSFT